MNDLEELLWLHVLESWDFLELEEPELEGEDNKAHDLVKPAAEEVSHNLRWHLVDYLQLISRSNGKELGDHVEVRHDCEAVQLIDQGGELRQRVLAHDLEVRGVANVGEDGLLDAEHLRVEEMHFGIDAILLDHERAGDRDLWVDAGIEEAFS